MTTHFEARRRWPSRAVSTALFLIVALVAATTCNHDAPLVPFCPAVYGVGVIDGRVTVAGEPIVAVVYARTIGGQGWVNAQTRSDSTGWYRLEVPWGTYQMELVGYSGGYVSERDTVHLDGDHRRFDMLRGRLAVHIALPPLAEGRRLLCSAYPVSPGGWIDREDALVTGSQVDFRFEGIRPDDYLIRVSSQDGGTLWLPGTINSTEADRVTVGDDREATYTGALAGFASISGSVRGSWQQVSQSTPIVEAIGNTGFTSGTEVGSDGSFTLDLLTAQAVRMRVTIGGVIQWIGGTSMEDATVFTPEPGQELQGVTWTESGIRCRLEGPGPRLFYRANVLVRDASGRIFDTYGESNSIAICNLSPGRYWLQVSGRCSSKRAEPWASQWYDGADSLAAATPIDVPEGQLVQVTVHLEDGARIEGRVLTADGSPVDQMGMTIIGPEGNSLCESWYTDHDGSFMFPGLIDGDYYLAVKIGSTSWWYPGTASLQTAVPIGIRNRTSVSGVSWRLPGS